MPRILSILLAFLAFFPVFSQLPVARDTITVIENGRVLKMPWANGINYNNVSQMDLNCDGKQDLVVFDKVTYFGKGVFRCFLKTGNPGQAEYRAAPQLRYSFPEVSHWATLVDFNCDNKEDIFCSTTSGIKVYKNTSASCDNLSFTLFKSLLYSDYYPNSPGPIGNLYASQVGVPGISDIDNDGDIDILTFSPEGIVIEFHRNMSIENGWNCDSLVFQRDDFCWGKISETSCEVTLNYSCVAKPAPQPGTPITVKRELHAGSCLMCFDSDGDGDKDLIMGDIGCSSVEYVHNTGTAANALFTDTTKLYPNYPLKNSTNIIKMNSFPCTYFVDVDGDGKKDLVAGPNAPGTENVRNLWYYQNTSTTDTVNFHFVKNNLLQDEMIDVGQSAFPALIDYDADGKKDLLIGTYGTYGGIAMSSSLALYRNIGTAFVPSFSLITRDFANLGSKGLNNIMPAVGDIDNDGDVDICLGTSTGQIHWLENTAGPGNPCNFSIYKHNPFGFTTISAAAAPQIFDLDKDNKPDLLIGMMNGRIAFYKNVGAAAPSFSLITNTLGGVDVKGDPSFYGNEGYAVPFFYDDGAFTKVLVGSVSGFIFQYQVPPVVTNSFTLLSSKINGINEGSQSSIWYEDINNDTKPDIFLGNGSGGLSFFSSSSPYVGIDEIGADRFSASVNVFPNPAKEFLNLTIDHASFTGAKVAIQDILGKTLFEEQMETSESVIPVSDLTPGIYFVIVQARLNAQVVTAAKKIVIE